MDEFDLLIDSPKDKYDYANTITGGEAESTLEAWDGTVATGFAGGSGTEADQFQISNGAQLAYLAQQVNGGNNYSGTYFKLTADLDLGGKEWTPIGSYPNYFCGTFDGGDHKIYRLKIESGESYIGLFGYLKQNSVNQPTIKNVKIASGIIIITEGESFNVGSIVGSLLHGKIDNCTASDVIIRAKQRVGGLVGHVYESVITNCHVLSASLSCSVQDAGGILGRAEYCQLTNCSVDDASIEGGIQIGGLKGYLSVESNYSSIQGCTVKADLKTGESNYVEASGGFVGYMNLDTHVAFSNCSFEGTLNGTEIAVSGIAVGSIYEDSSSKTLTFENCTYKIDDATKTFLTKDGQYLLVGFTSLRYGGCIGLYVIVIV